MERLGSYRAAFKEQEHKATNRVVTIPPAPIIGAGFSCKWPLTIKPSQFALSGDLFALRQGSIHNPDQQQGV